LREHHLSELAGPDLLELMPITTPVPEGIRRSESESAARAVPASNTAQIEYFRRRVSRLVILPIIRFAGTDCPRLRIAQRQVNPGRLAGGPPR